MYGYAKVKHMPMTGLPTLAKKHKQTIKKTIDPFFRITYF